VDSDFPAPKLPRKRRMKNQRIARKLTMIEPGAEEGTRTPTPLRVHGPEPCASANSATSAMERAMNSGIARQEELRFIFYRGDRECQTVLG
jgi:hypothetical protein